MPQLPQGTVAFLFTDIAGSTRLWHEHPEAMRAAYERHDAIFQDTITRHHGVIYKHIGDAVQAAFPTSHGAVNAAMLAQMMLTSEDWTTCGLPAPLRVRMAVHVGDVDPDQDGDYRSPVLNRAGRLLGAGHGGQVLLSRAVVAALEGALPAGATLRDLGEHLLKDLEPEHIWQLGHAELPERFPPLAAPRPENLPLPPTPLIGREDELARILGLLAEHAGRLVTLLGPGGIGKTRLGLAVARAALPGFGAGAFFVPLATLQDPILLPGAIAAALGITEEPGRPALETVEQHVRDRHLLLLLDNAEQVIEGVADLTATLLATCPRLVVLVTSRRPLRIRAERVVHVPVLGVPEVEALRQGMQPQQAESYPAVRLFIQQAQAVKPGFALDTRNAPAVAEICHRLDGLPLAIELATARVRMFPPQALLARLERRLPLLTGGTRDVPARQQTLHNAIAWSYDLLSTDEQEVFRRLAVFAGGCTFEAAEAVANPVGTLDVFSDLEHLLEHSLMQQTVGADGEPRFTMLETIREFGQEQLASLGEFPETQARHAAWCVSLFAPDGRGEMEERVWFDRLEDEHHNLREALTWFIEHGDAASALTMLDPLVRFWELRAHIREGLMWSERVLALEGEVAPELRIGGLNAVGELRMWVGDFDQATASFLQGLPIARQIESSYWTWLILRNLGAAARFDGDLTSAQRWLKEALTTAIAMEHPGWAYDTHVGLADVAIQAGDLARGAEILRDLLSEPELAHDDLSRRYALLSLAWVSLHQGHPKVALNQYQECLSLFQAERDQMGATIGVFGIAASAVELGATAEALPLLRAALKFQQERGFIIEANEQAMNDRTLAKARLTLTASAFDMAWEIGFALTLDDAIEAAEELVVRMANCQDFDESSAQSDT